MKKFILGLLVGITISIVCLNTYNSKAQAQLRSRYMDIGDKYIEMEERFNTNWTKIYATRALAAYVAAIAEKIECKCD